MASYYKAERERAERCLDDILGLFLGADEKATDLENKIIGRLIDHYSRSIPTSNQTETK